MMRYKAFDSIKEISSILRRPRKPVLPVAHVLIQPIGISCPASALLFFCLCCCSPRQSRQYQLVGIRRSARKSSLFRQLWWWDNSEATASNRVVVTLNKTRDLYLEYCSLVQMMSYYFSELVPIEHLEIMTRCGNFVKFLLIIHCVYAGVVLYLRGNRLWRYTAREISVADPGAVPGASTNFSPAPGRRSMGAN